MSILQLPQESPRVLLLDWHGTLVNTRAAMYHALDEVLPQLEALGLLDHLVPPEQSRSSEDARLVAWVRQHRKLHPRIRDDRKISRTDIFEVLFGSDEDAKSRAHAAFDSAYQTHLESVEPMEADAYEQLSALRALGLKLGLISNRRRAFLEAELDGLEGGRWWPLFDTLVCGDDGWRRKPAPDMLLQALVNLGDGDSLLELEGCWYLGDSTTDVVAASEAGVTPVFYNGAGWDQRWLDTIFPGSMRHPHQPKAVVASLAALQALVRQVLAQGLRVSRAQQPR
ncbi:HAD family hydrolase [Isoalcanivorax beigongshangi]|uniref:phosphoglycolate phosphatase n=1 Tax=Isoalcanivorax beigongshangi TaxID=3238810 RepID=A0ABV4AHK6_9GAMM